MQDFTKSLYTAPPLPILELVKELTIGQRSTDTIDQLAVFLHTNIFPKLWPFFIEIYFQDDFSGNFLPSQSQLQNQAANRPSNVPESIRGNHPIISQLAETRCPAEILSESQPTPFLTSTNNSIHLLVPIQDGPELSGLLYLGSPKPCSLMIRTRFLRAGKVK
ncbi:MAG: hypothetical protein SRB2_03935 [Desulfobacteraceae bacterium Eth-SRB2]|nr:MAG: hypothetical protein SRB2_03935 [Desulfobacteraceae bacterium Eth-SRB2]